MNRKFQSNGEDKKGGLYHLLLRLPRKIKIQVGALGRQIFPSGYYVYTGSAKRGLAHRLARHLRKKKKRHWHIDYLTAVAPLKQILIDVSDRFTECQAHQAVMNARGAEVIVAGFGSSDCRCRSHLAYFEKKPVVQNLLSSRFSLIVIFQKHPPKILIPSSVGMILNSSLPDISILA